MQTAEISVADILRGLRKRAGLSMASLAQLAGYKGASSLQRYENPEQFQKRFLPYDVVERLAAALVGRGQPPISRAEVFAMAGPIGQAAFPLDTATTSAREHGATPAQPAGANEAEFVPGLEPPSPASMTKDLPVMGTAAGSAGDGAVQFEGGVIEFVRRPPALVSVKDAYAIYVVGNSMEPRLQEGSLQVVHPHRRPRPGDDVVLQIQRAADVDLQVYVKQLDRITENAVICRHYCNTDDELVFNRDTVRAMHKILTNEDLFGF
ncbi:MAG: S24 family peptidase [Alphaproteobacteria bacterium]